MRHQALAGAAGAAPRASRGPESKPPAGRLAVQGDMNDETEHRHCAPAEGACLDKAVSLKPWLRLQAECLIAGFPATLTDGDDGRPLLVVSRWALTRAFSTVAEAEGWLSRVSRGIA